MLRENETATCPRCGGQLTPHVARGLCENEWSDFYCHYCQQDFFRSQIAAARADGDNVLLELVLS
jgi:hypothetical protein